ncbi:MAG: hypothetical protein RL685_7338 [Pseudomonadota bacterium]|jgi:uncharacterized protein (DUF2141 family)
MCCTCQRFNLGHRSPAERSLGETPERGHRRLWAATPALCLMVCSGASAAAPEAPSPAEAVPTEIVLVGKVPVDKGHLRCGLYDREGWLTRPLQRAMAVPRDRRGECRFQPSSAGTYALGAFLDINENGTLDRNLLGYPKEPYGVSNGARIRFFLPPSFDAAKVEYTGAELKLELLIE